MKPSATNIISQINSKSGTTIAHGLQNIITDQKVENIESYPVKRLRSVRKTTTVQSIPEQGFEIFWQFSTSSIARIHGDKNSHSGHKRDVFALEYKSFFLVTNGILYGLDLYGNNRQYFHRDTIEFIKAAPGTRLRKTLVDVATGLE
jgi:hypothetical protein